MAETKYTYSVADDFPNAAVDSAKFHSEIAESAIVTTFLRIDLTGDVCDVWFEAALSSGDEDLLDGLVAVHDGTPTLHVYFRNSALLAEKETIITETTNWQYLGGVVTNVGFLADWDAARLAMHFARCIGWWKAVGTGAELRVVMDNGVTPVVLVTPSYSIANTSGAWAKGEFNTNVGFGMDDCEYRIEGRLNAATSASIRSTSLTLLELGV